MVTDPYKVLGISKDATEDEIKKAYRKKAKECHPDLHPDDPHAQEKMNEVNEAYDMLKNPEKYRQQTFNGYANSSNPYGQSYGGYQQNGQTYTYTYTNMNDFFNDFFYQQQRASTIPMPNFEEGDSEEIKNVVSYIRGQNYQMASRYLMNISNRDARWYYLYALSCYGMGYRDRAYQSIQKSIQMDPYKQEYQQVYNVLSQYQQNSFYNQGPFTYQRTAYARPRHGILYYFFMFQLLMMIFNFLFGGFGYSQQRQNENYYQNETPANEYQRTSNADSYD